MTSIHTSGSRRFSPALCMRAFLFWTARLCLLGTVLAWSAGESSSQEQVDREPAVAGQFYPLGKKDLLGALKIAFAAAEPSRHLTNVVAIVVPHAGYIYSASVAASSFNQIDTSIGYDNIFILGPSHYVDLDGAAIYTEGNYRTPLGAVPVNMALGKSLVQKYDCFTSRTDAHLREHSIEVQLPFLQYRMKRDFRIVPIVIGATSLATCEKIADALRPFFNSRNLFVISTDFSHYPAYRDAVEVDRATASAIGSNSVNNLVRTLEDNARKGTPNLATSLCGWPCVLVLLSMTQGNPSITMEQIRYANSGDSGLGDSTRVVGYDAIAVSLRGTSGAFDLSVGDKRKLLSAARTSIDQYVRNRRVAMLDTTEYSATLKTLCGAFVTLRKNGELRGCIGRLGASEPLYRVVQEMAIAAATQDPRFSPVGPDEINSLLIEISVLTPLEKISSIDDIELGKHGIVIQKGMRSGTFLPQVASETGWSKEEFLGHCAQDKAGLGWNGWKDADIFTYEAKVFDESGVDLK